MFVLFCHLQLNKYCTLYYEECKAVLKCLMEVVEDLFVCVLFSGFFVVGSFFLAKDQNSSSSMDVFEKVSKNSSTKKKIRHNLLAADHNNYWYLLLRCFLVSNYSYPTRYQ